MPIIVLLVLHVVFYSGFRMFKLSVLIARERDPEGKKGISLWEEIWKGEGNHLWPGPYFSEHGDSATVNRFIKERNMWTAISWTTMILGGIAGFILQKIDQSQ
jgi:hypothetical protein